MGSQLPPGYRITYTPPPDPASSLPPGYRIVGADAPQQSGGSWLDSVLSALGQGGVGAAKGAGSTAFGLGSIANSASKVLQSPLYPQTGIGDMIFPGSFDQKPPELVPQGTAQKVGYGAEQMAEFLVPGGAATKAAKGLPLAERMAVQALAGGGVGAAQSGGAPADTLMAALGGAGGEALAAGAGKLLKPFSRSVDTAATEAAARQGVELPASAASNSKSVALLESSFGGSEAAAQYRTAQNQLATTAANAVKDASELGTASEVGKSVADGFAKYRAAFQKTKGALYDAAALPESGVKVDASETRALLDRIVGDKKQAATVLGDAKDLAFFTTLRKRLDKPIEASVLLNARKELSRRVANFNDPLATGNKGILKSVVASMDGELDGAIAKARPDISAKLAEADAFYKDGISKINSAFGKSITKLAQTGQYDKISQAITNSRMSVDDITGIMKVAGPEGADGMRMTVLADMFAKAKTANGEGFMPLSLSRQIGNFGPERLQALLAPDQWDKLKDLALLTTTLQRGQKIAEGSQTAYIGRTAAGISGLISNPVLALKAMAGDYAFSKFITSSYGQRWMTSGLSLPKPGAAVLRVAPQARAIAGRPEGQ